MYKVYIGNANDTDRPDREYSPLNDKWELLASGTTAQATLDELIELANDEQFSLENSWLRLETTQA